MFALDRADPLLRFFLLEKIREGRRDPLELIERTLEKAVHGEWKPGEPLRLPFQAGPCFITLVPNLVALILDLRADKGDTTTPIHLEGAHLANFNLDSIWGTRPRSPMILEAANLESATLSIWSRRPDHACIAPDGSHESVRQYCTQNYLFGPPRFSEDERDGFVLIPAGAYQVAQHLDGDRDPSGSFVEVRLRSYLIQRYPVTNRQFAAFLCESPQYQPSRIREETDNPWYLLSWPETKDDPRLTDPKWLDRPVVHVSWIAADAFAASCGLRLPTEVEWEVASRYTGDFRSATTRRPWGEHIDRNWAVFWDTGGNNGVAAAVASRPTEIEQSPPLLPSRIVYEPRPAFMEWASGRDVPYFMVDLVREWVADQWDSTFPCLEPGVVDFSI